MDTSCGRTETRNTNNNCHLGIQAECYNLCMLGENGHMTCGGDGEKRIGRYHGKTQRQNVLCPGDMMEVDKVKQLGGRWKLIGIEANE